MSLGERLWAVLREIRGEGLKPVGHQEAET